MTFLGITGLINFITSATLGIFVLSRNPRSSLNRSYFYGNCSVAIFSFGYLIWQLCENETDALFWFKVLSVGFILINVTFLHFVFSFMGMLKRKRIELYIYYFINIVFIFLNIGSFLYTKVEPKFDLGFWPSPTFLFDIYLGFWFWLCLYGFFWLLRGLRYTTGIKREQIKYLSIAVIIGFLGGASNWPIWYNINLPPYPNILISLYVFLVAYSMIRYHLLDIRVALSRAGIFLIVYTFVLGIPFWLGFYTDFGIVSYLAMFIMATTGPILYRYFQGKAESVLLAQQKRYQKFLHKAARGIVRQHDLDRLVKLIAYITTKAVGIEFAVIFLQDKENNCYKIKAERGGHPFPKEYSISDNHPSIELIKSQEGPFFYNNVNHFYEYSMKKPVHLIVPFIIDNRLLGFLFLGEKRNKSFYTQDDYDAFEILSNQASLAIENCLFLEENKRVQERLFQTEKLSIIGGMAEGVAHQIKNRLNFFSIAASGVQLEVDNFLNNYNKLIIQHPELKRVFDDLGKISVDLIENVKKTDEVIHKVIDYARVEEKENSFSEFSLGKMVDLAASLVQIRHEFNQSPVELDLGSSDTIYGIKSQILESLYNIFDNSYEAIDEKMKYRLSKEEKNAFKPVIQLKLLNNENYYYIEVFDNGVGIKEENKEKIFAPYFTTKPSHKDKPNSGIGMYIMSRIIKENHNGEIWFESEYMKGTTVYIKLPKKVNNIPIDDKNV